MTPRENRRSWITATATGAVIALSLTLMGCAGSPDAVDEGVGTAPDGSTDSDTTVVSEDDQAWWNESIIEVKRTLSDGTEVICLIQTDFGSMWCKEVGHL